MLYALMSGTLPFPERAAPDGADDEDEDCASTGLPTPEELEFGKKRNMLLLVRRSVGSDSHFPPLLDTHLERLKRRQQFQLPPWCSPECEDLIRKLLQVREEHGASRPPPKKI